VTFIDSKDERLVTDAEVLQELMHRYISINRMDAIQPAFDAIVGIVDEVFPIEAADVQQAKTVLAGSRRLSARDRSHPELRRWLRHAAWRPEGQHSILNHAVSPIPVSQTP
jgi:hypothetical protein